MKLKSYSLLLITAMLFLPRVKGQTTIQGDITLNQTPIFNHDSTSCYSFGIMWYDITIANSFLNDTVWVINLYDHTLIDTAVNHTGQNPWQISFTMNQGNYYIPDEWFANTPGPVYMNGVLTKIINVHSNTSADTIYNIMNDINGYVSNPCIYGNVTGKVYIDNNSNCTFDGSDIALNSLSVDGMANLASPSSASIHDGNAYTDNNGNYSLSVQQTYMTNYTVQLPSSYAFIFPSTFCSPSIYTYTTLPQNNVDFSLQCTSNIDVACYATSTGIVRPNVPFYMNPFVSNTGCIAASGTLKFVLDNRVIYDSSLSVNPATAISGDTLIWTYTNLNNLSSGGYWNSFISNLNLTPNTSVNIGDTLCFRIMATIQSGDVDVSNNDYTICLPVVNSYDPNFKEVSPKGKNSNGEIPATTDKLFYTVHFQNTGNAVAYNISVIDTLDSDVIPSSLQILGTSHNVTPEWIAPGVVKFNFYSIYLADSASDEAASHAVFRYSVKLNSGLTAGTQIKNTANIYFDYNDAIVTNTTINTIMQPTGVEEHLNLPVGVKVYPNPFSDNATFIVQSNHSNEIYSFEMLDVLGKNVKTIQNITTKEFTVSRADLPDGVYFYKIKTSEKVLSVGKLIVQ
jgi:uncharacterized repeat protein (TIGR01451 family)